MNVLRRTIPGTFARAFSMSRKNTSPFRRASSASTR